MGMCCSQECPHVRPDKIDVAKMLEKDDWFHLLSRLVDSCTPCEDSELLLSCGQDESGHVHELSHVLRVILEYVPRVSIDALHMGKYLRRPLLLQALLCLRLTVVYRWHLALMEPDKGYSDFKRLEDIVFFAHCTFRVMRHLEFSL